jgi:hypothetical protein
MILVHIYMSVDKYIDTITVIGSAFPPFFSLCLFFFVIDITTPGYKAL